MQWHGEYSTEWKRHFAFFLTSVEKGTKVVWLQFYWRKYFPGEILCEYCQLVIPNRVVGHWKTSSYKPKKDPRHEP